jgi:hypothetical protein
MSADNGVATFPADLFTPGRSRPQLSALVATDTEQLLLASVPYPSSPPALLPTATLITDRGVYKANDSVRLKGYVRVPGDLGKLRVPSAAMLRTASFKIRVRWMASGKSEETALSVDVLHGSFDATLHVPANATYGTHSLTLSASGLAGTRYARTLTSLTVAVADPRPPTVELGVATPASRVLQPGSTIRLVVSTTTMSGVPIKAQTVALWWQLTRGSNPSLPPTPRSADGDGSEDEDVDTTKGEESVMTGADGTFTNEWHPKSGGANVELRLGDQLELSFEYIGPTRERCSTSLSVPVALSERTLSLTASSAAKLPGHPFVLTATLAKHGALGGEAVPGIPIELSLYADQVHADDVEDEDDDSDAPRNIRRRGIPVPSHGSAWMTNVAPSQLPGGPSLAARCELTSGEQGASTKGRCDLALPSMGRFIAVSCTLASTGGARTLCSSILLGKSAAQWHREPLTEYLRLAVEPAADRPLYSIGDAPLIELHNPTGAPLRAMLAWGSAAGHHHLVSSSLPTGPNRIELPALDESCADGCEVSITLVAAASSTRLLPVPASPLLDVSGPLLATFAVSLNLRRPAEQLHVALALGSVVVEPGSTASLTLSLTDGAGRPTSGEVALFAVDKALLAVRPHPPRNLSVELAAHVQSDYYSTTDSYGMLASPSAIAHSAEALQRMLAADPWLPATWPVRPSRSLIEQSLSAVLASHATSITSMPDGGDEPIDRMEMYAMDDAVGGMRMRSRSAPTMMLAREAPMMAMAAEADVAEGMPMLGMAKSAPMASATGGGMGEQGSAPAGPKVKVRSSFETTPLFLPRIAVVDGSTTISWQLPDNTGGYEMRAYAVKSSDGSLGGGATITQLVRKRVTLVASVPRVARVGDSFRCGVVVTGSPELPPHSTVRATLASRQPQHPQPIKLVGSTEQSVTLGPSETIELTFEMVAETLGEASLVATVRESVGGAMDAIELKVPVLGVQPAVTVATSMALRVADRAWPDSGGGVRVWPEGIALPAAVPGSGTISIGAAAGRLAAVRALAVGLLSLPSWGESPCASSLLAAAAASAMLAPYEAAAALTQRTTQAQAALALLPDATASLATMTNANGLHYSAYAMAHSTNNGVDLHLNALGLFVVRRLRLAGVSVPPQLVALGELWRAALAHGLVDTATESIRRWGSWDDHHTLASCRLALGRSWRPTRSSPAVVAALSLEALQSGVDDLSAYGKAAFALTLLLPADPVNDGLGATWLRAGIRRGSSPLEGRLGAVLRFLSSCLRVTARTAYLARDAHTWDAAGSRDTALALSALAIGAASGDVGASSANLDKLANHVASGGFDGVDGGSLFDGLALADYDGASGSLAADVRLEVRSGSQVVYNARLRAADAVGPATKQLRWSELPPPPPPPLLFSASGVGEVSVALALRFVPATIFSVPLYRGIEVLKIVRRFDALHNRPAGPPLSSVPLGMVVAVTIQLTSPDELSSLVVEDWLPAGLEVIDPNANGGQTDGGSGPGGGTPWPWLSGCAWWWRCTSWSRETRKERVTFYASWAHAGTHTLQYEAIAATRGAFVLPPARCAAALQPEVMGLSAGGTLRVLAASEQPVALAAGRSGDVATTGKRCPRDCAGRGTCNPESGRCTCIAGAAGKDCTATRSAPTIGALNANDSIAVETGRAEPHIITLPVQSPTLSLRSSNAAPPPMPPPPPAVEPLRYFYALSSHEELLPSSAISLSTPSPSSLRLAVLTEAISIARETCVWVTVAASVDGLLFGSRVLAIWLSPSAGVLTPPSSCVGDGTAYEPAVWEESTSTVSSLPQQMPSAASSFAPLIAVAVIILASVPMIRKLHETRQHAGMRRLRDYPTPADSPGSQSGAVCGPAMVELVDSMELVDK